MKAVSDDEMNALLASVRAYSVAILRPGPRFADEGAQSLIWEHGRRNLGLRHDGPLAIVLPVADASQLCGVCVFNTTVEDATAIMNADPAVAAEVLRFDVHPCGGFPGDCLP